MPLVQDDLKALRNIRQFLNRPIGMVQYLYRNQRYQRRRSKRINKDPSTIQKWLRGTSKYLSAETENEIILELRKIKEIWENINI